MSEDTSEIRPDVECDAFQKAVAYIRERADTTKNKKMIAAAEAIEAATQCAIIDKENVASLNMEAVSKDSHASAMVKTIQLLREQVAQAKAECEALDQAKKAEANAIVAMRIAQAEAATMRECMNKVFPTPFSATAAIHPKTPDTFGV
ncbi:hypothetical protein [Thalassobius sp. Cn5-15]|uniref:hypothetical protein n=1 Tax=Thalassobius sp. Cn5-15 TaxID=2917763 RepID=UPI001EF33974|nr:hypothetical protein [Thalassobius sp. Cn5-15]MCG7492403.1 hypothetical protein [Thalassobius sp. Cn5-15]